MPPKCDCPKYVSFSLTLYKDFDMPTTASGIERYSDIYDALVQSLKGHDDVLVRMTDEAGPSLLQPPSAESRRMDIDPALQQAFEAAQAQATGLGTTQQQQPGTSPMVPPPPKPSNQHLQHPESWPGRYQSFPVLDIAST